MKIILLNVLLFVNLSTFGQGFHERHPELPKFVKSIDSQIKSLKAVTLENEEFLVNLTDGAGVLTGYYLGDELVKIELWTGVSYGKYEFDYYFKDSELFYIIESFKQYSYDADSDTWDYSKLNQTFRGDYLFQPTFNYETLGHNRFENDELDPEEVLTQEAMEYIKLLSKKTNARD